MTYPSAFRISPTIPPWPILLFLIVLLLPQPLRAQELPPPQAQRIVPLYSAFTEILLALGAKDTLVACTVQDAKNPLLSALPSVGTHMRPNFELICASKPDLVVLLRGRSDAAMQAESLRKLNLKVLELPLNSFADLFSATLLLGASTGREKEAQALLQEWKERLRTIAQRTEKLPKVRVFYEVRSPILLAAGQGNIVNEIIELCGGINVVKSPKKLVRISAEALLALNPDVYLMQQGPMNPNPLPLEERPHMQLLSACKEKRSYVVQEELFSRASPNALKACEELVNLLHPMAKTKGAQ